MKLKNLTIAPVTRALDVHPEETGNRGHADLLVRGMLCGL
jgi:hypothetical protein